MFDQRCKSDTANKKKLNKNTKGQTIMKKTLHRNLVSNMKPTETRCTHHSFSSYGSKRGARITHSQVMVANEVHSSLILKLW